MDKLMRVLSGNDSPVQPDEQSGLMSYYYAQNIEASTLSYSTRIKGFVVCFVFGVLTSVLGAVELFMHRELAEFAVLYTVGNIMSMASTCFLMGPVSQMDNMFASTRWIATVVAIVAFVMTLVSAIALEKAGLTLLNIIIQSMAMTWYSLSCIAWARDAVKKTTTSLLAERALMLLIPIAHAHIYECQRAQAA